MPLIMKITPKSYLIVNLLQVSPAAPNYISLVELQLSITGMTVGPTLGSSHCIVDQTDSSFRRSLLVEVRGDTERPWHGTIISPTATLKMISYNNLPPQYLSA